MGISEAHTVYSLMQITAPDTLSIRAEMIVPGATFRMTPLEDLPTLRTSLFVNLIETETTKSGELFVLSQVEQLDKRIVN